MDYGDSLSNEEDASRSVPSDYHVVARCSDAEDDEDDVTAFQLETRVENPKVVSDRIGTHVIYTVTTKTNSTSFSKSESVVARRFSDFLGLHNKLVLKYAVEGRIVPPPPAKQTLGSISARFSQDDDAAVLTHSFYERRRAALERFLLRCAKHPVLRKDSDFVAFLETEEDLPRATDTSTLSAAAFGRLFAKVEDKVSTIGLQKMEETDSWFAEKQNAIELLDNQLRKLEASVESIIAQRKDLAANTSQFARSCALLSNAEEHGGLARAFSHLSEVEEKVEAVHLEQANGDLSRLAETLADYIALLGSVKNVFNQRTKLYHTWQSLQTASMKKRAWLAGHRQAGGEKLRTAELEMRELEARVETSQRDFDDASAVIRKEMSRFEATRIEDFKKMILAYLETLMAGQRKIVAEIAASVDAMQTNLLSSEEYTTLADLFQKPK